MRVYTGCGRQRRELVLCVLLDIEGTGALLVISAWEQVVLSCSEMPAPQNVTPGSVCLSV